MGFWSELFAPGEAARSDRLDAELRAHNARRVERGVMTPDDYLRFEERLGQNDSSTFDQQVEDAFVEGAREGLEKQQQAVKRTLTATVKAAVGFVPWWAWVILAVAGLAWLANSLGLFQLLKRKVQNAA